MEIKNLKKAADRIRKAIKRKERVVLYGDSDLDGATSVIILQDAIKSLGGEVAAVYFPDKEAEGYGITQQGLNLLKSESPTLLIVLDCGVGNIKEVKLANKMGFEVMIVDHHEIPDKLPAAEIIVDPKQEGDEYPFKDFSAAGLVFKLAEVLLGDKLTESLRRNLVELAALSTIADMMPQKSENKIFVEEGLSYLENSWRPGIKAFLEAEAFKECSNVNQKVSRIISILNIRDVKNALPASFRLLVCSSVEEAGEIISLLLEKDEVRRKRIGEIEDEVERRIQESRDPIIFEGGPDFDLQIISSVASIISRRYSKPVFLYKKLAKESQGTVRSPREVNSVSLMKKCSKLLLTYGGHPPAAGFRIKNVNLEKFKECLIKNI
ncbi:MAG: DHH family phosphoesterase [bacterium]|nr:DHH family phosphoesterase [bacterium]